MTQQESLDFLQSCIDSLDHITDEDRKRGQMIFWGLMKDVIRTFDNAINSEDNEYADEIWMNYLWIFVELDKEYQRILCMQSKDDCVVLKGHKSLDYSAYGLIAISQFVHPDHNSYTNAENPIVQMLDLVDDIQEGKIVDQNGDKIPTEANTQFYLYIVCDINQKLRKIAAWYGFYEMPDKQGMYKYNEQMRAYIEIRSYEKTIKDAMQRNSVLTEK